MLIDIIKYIVATLESCAKLIINALPWTLIFWLFCNKVLIPSTYICWIDTDHVYFYQALISILMFHTLVKIIKKGVI